MLSLFQTNDSSYLIFPQKELLSKREMREPLQDLFMPTEGGKGPNHILCLHSPHKSYAYSLELSPVTAGFIDPLCRLWASRAPLRKRKVKQELMWRHWWHIKIWNGFLDFLPPLEHTPLNVECRKWGHLKHFNGKPRLALLTLGPSSIFILFPQNSFHVITTICHYKYISQSSSALLICGSEVVWLSGYHRHILQGEEPSGEFGLSETGVEWTFTNVKIRKIGNFFH